MVAVVADSAANLPPEVAAELGVRTVPMYVRLGEQVFRDGADLTPSDLYDRLAQDRVLASTSTPTPADFLEAYRATGDAQVVCVTVSAAMSAVHQQAARAAEDFDGTVEVVDSLSASMAEGFVAMEAARSAASGAPLETVAARAREVAGRTTLLATVDTFEFLRRSGRVTKLQAYAATMLDIKPVFRYQGGDVSPVGRPRTRSRAIRRVVEDTVAEIAGRPVHLAAIHAAALADARSVLDQVAAAAKVVERFVVEVTPVVGAHTGPGLVGTAFFCD